jgi:2-amino-4-hydroxy-6-hydroxymethyldihydropteridine diphosphokinase
MKEQDNFLNMALFVTSTKDVDEVFQVTKTIESAIGTNKKEKWGPREIDIDILYCDDKIIDSESLKIPHPQLYNRNFVLVPMIEIAGDFVDPVKKISLDEIYDMCEDNGEVFLYEA